ncbi:winged helix-turn-helix domain-containing protein [Aeromonas veronii]|uniref:winged helix-turn-helix domain-containing protein n=1 Tax=Aeromonas veronii TaxID=654 RepID=UPI003D1B4426
MLFCADKDNLQSARVVRLSSAESLIFSYLLDHHDEVCDKDLLLEIGWLGRPISPNSLNVAIANIRRHFASALARAAERDHACSGCAATVDITKLRPRGHHRACCSPFFW